MNNSDNMFESVESTETEEINDVEETENNAADTDAESNPVSSDETVLVDVSSGEGRPDIFSVDISSGDVSAGDVSGNSPGNQTIPSVAYSIPETLEVACTCHTETSPLLWESDIAQYSVTDGLLLLILITLVLDIVIFRRK